jgi:hypothetical protein
MARKSRFSGIYSKEYIAKLHGRIIAEHPPESFNDKEYEFRDFLMEEIRSRLNAGHFKIKDNILIFGDKKIPLKEIPEPDGFFDINKSALPVLEVDEIQENRAWVKNRQGRRFPVKINKMAEVESVAFNLEMGVKVLAYCNPVTGFEVLEFEIDEDVIQEKGNVEVEGPMELIG